jgi:GNAT superfamily N-acetyltransferase
LESWTKFPSLFLPSQEEVVYSDGNPIFKSFCEELLHRSGIQMLTPKELYKMAAINSRIVGAIFVGVGWTKNFSFDVVVVPEHRGRGIGTELVRLALEKYENLKAEGEAEYCLVEVVSETMEFILADKFGFRVSHTKRHPVWGTRISYMTDRKDEDGQD